VTSERILGLSFAAWKILGLIAFVAGFVTVVLWVALTRRARFDADARLVLDDGREAARERGEEP
jgi:hypothetical protein